MKCLITAANVGKDADVKALEGGSYQFSFSVCENERRKGTNGEVISEPHWYSCLYFARSAKLGEYIRKGAKVCIWGDVRTSTYTNDSTGEKRVSFDILVSELKIIAFAGDGQKVDPATGEVLQRQQPTPQTTAANYASEPPASEDELPF